MEEVQEGETESTEALLSKNLRLAAEDEEEAQVWVGRYYVELSETQESEKGQETARAGVDWLVKASKFGNENATTLLKDCLEKKRGITELNVQDVLWCINTPQIEKNVRKAAHEMFSKLNPLGGRSISTEEIEKNLSSVGLNPKDWDILKNAAEIKGELSEDDFVNKLVKRTMFGFQDLGSLLHHDVETETYNQASFFTKVTRYPVRTGQVYIDQLLEAVGQRGLAWLQGLVPSTQLYLLVAVWIYSLLTLDLLRWLLPLALFYPAFFALITATLQMFYNKRKLSDVEQTASFLHRFNASLNPDTVASTYQLSSVTPYLSFFLCLPLLILLYSLADLAWIPSSELTCLTLLMTAVTFQALSDNHDKFALLTILLDLYSSLPRHLPESIDSSLILSFLFGSGFSFELFPNATVSISLPSLAMLAIPGIITFMGLRAGSVKKALSLIIPHLVCFSWWKLTLWFFHAASWRGLLRGSLGWLLLLLLAPVLLLILVLWMIYALVNMLSLGGFIKLLMSALVIGLPIAFGFWAKSGFKFQGFSLKNKTRTARVILAVFGICSSVPLLLYLSPSSSVVTAKPVAFGDYAAACGAPQWEESNQASTTILCQHLEGLLVDWRGTIKQVNIKDSSNQAEQVLSWLPHALSHWLRCTYGEEYPSNVTDPYEQWIYELASTQPYRSCHLKKFSRYTFQISVTMSVGDDVSQTIYLDASAWFKDVLMSLKTDDIIRYRATLTSGLGTAAPRANVHMIQCLSCDDNKIYGRQEAMSDAAWEVANMLRSGAMQVGNFYLQPFLELSQDGQEKDVNGSLTNM